MTVGVDSKESREGGVGSRGGEGKGRTTAVIATKGTIAATVRKITLNSLMIGVAFREMVLSGLGASMKTLSMMAILNGVGQLAAKYP